MTSYLLEYTPAQYLRRHSAPMHSKKHKSLAMHMVTAARMYIPGYWKQTRVPSLKEWFVSLDKLANTEELISIA